LVDDAIEKLRHRGAGDVGSLAMRRMADTRKTDDLDRRPHQFLHGGDLRARAVDIRVALDDLHRTRDRREILRQIPRPEAGIEPGAVPTEKCVVDILVPALGRIANFINGELWGRATDVPWAFVFPHGGPPRDRRLSSQGSAGFDRRRFRQPLPLLRDGWRLRAPPRAQLLALAGSKEFQYS